MHRQPLSQPVRNLVVLYLEDHWEEVVQRDHGELHASHLHPIHGHSIPTIILLSPVSIVALSPTSSDNRACVQ